jgi:hypothetical protein
MNALSLARPQPGEYAEYYERYISLVPEGDILIILSTQLDETTSLLGKVTETEGNTRHPPYTWSVKEVVGHLIDAERIFGGRAFRFARGDATPLPSFDENAYAREGHFDARLVIDLAEEFETVRRLNLYLFKHLSADHWLRTGVASDNTVSVRALAYIMAGHVRHHAAILRKRLARS